MILYFSGTGNSAYAAKYIAGELHDEVVNLNDKIKAGDNSLLTSDKPWIVAAPVYCWQLPRLVRDWMQKTEFRGSKDIYFVMTCGDAQGEGNIAVRGAGGQGGGEAVVFPDGGCGPLCKVGIVHIQAAGPVTHRFDRDLNAGSAELLHNAVKFCLHECQPLPLVGAELIEHLGTLRDGIDGGAAADGADVVGGLSDGRDLHLIEPGNEPGELGDGVGGTEAGIGMAAFGGDRDPEAAGAHRFCDDCVGVAVEGDKLLHPVTEICQDLPASLQVAQALLAGIDDQQNAAVSGCQTVLKDKPCHGQQGHRVGGVIAHAGTVDAPVFRFQGQGSGVRENHVGMGHEDHQVVVAGVANGVNDIQSFINICIFRTHGVEPV